MSSLRQKAVRHDLIQRLQRLTPTTQPQWGKLDAPRLLCHLSDTLSIALGDLPAVSAGKTAFGRFPLKHLILYVFPIPKNVGTAPEMLSSQPREFEADKQRCLKLMERLAAVPPGMGAEHPHFGPLTNDEWNTLQAKHIGHHLKQFGI